MNIKDIIKKSLELHKKTRGKIEIKPKVSLETAEDLALYYTPGVAEVCKKIVERPEAVNDYTNKKNSVAIITDGSAILGLGNIGPEAGLPVMEGKAAIFKRFANIDAYPILLNTQELEEIIKTIKNIAPTFSAINLEDIAAPGCFEIVKRLSKELDIPVFHDDQDGTAIVVLAGLINALKVVGKGKDVKILISGAGAAGIAIAKILGEYGMNNYCLCDSKGTISECRLELNGQKKTMMVKSAASCPCSNKCTDALPGTDVLIGVSKPNQFMKEDIKKMNPNAVVFALANPAPEIMPEEAKKGSAKIIATGRSDFPNQVNNALVFPGLFRGLLDSGIRKVTPEIKIAVAESIAGMIKNPTPENFIPSIFDKNLVKIISDAVKSAK
ncbi:MAG: NADP-dependent malic enzyme [Patescibacteria group bacterium]|nr:NADP-dependent malic enzyme [Patescibacteria group bacterium]